MSTEAELKRMIVREVRSEQPAFTVIQQLLRALKDMMAHQRRLSVDDVSGGNQGESYGDSDGGITLTNNSVVATTGEAWAGMSEREYRRQNRGRQRESMQDQMLSTMDQAIQRATTSRLDPFVAIMQSLPFMELVYPDPVERETILAAVRSEIQFRLGPRLPAPTPLLEDQETQETPP